MEAHQQYIEDAARDSLAVTVPELEALSSAERRSYGVYGTAAVSLLLIMGVTSPLAHPSDGLRFVVVAVLCAVLGTAFIVALRGLRRLFHLEQAAQNRFLAALASARGVAPLEPVDMTTRPDSIVLTDGVELTLWAVTYSGEEVSLVRVPPTPAAA